MYLTLGVCEYVRPRASKSLSSWQAEIYPPIGLLTEGIMNCVPYFRAKKIVCLFFGRTNSFDKGDRYQACISAVA